MKKAHSNIALIILAAGESKRMGQPKQLLSWKKTTLLGHCIQQAELSQAQDIYVVLGAHFNSIKQSLTSNNITILKHDQWALGLGYSIRFGIRHIKDQPYDGALLILADQPQVNSAYINRILSTFHNTNTKSIIATSYPKSKGIPILFAKCFFEDIILNTPAKGAKSILQKHNQYLISIESENDLEDIDTLDDYKRLFHKLQ